MLQSHAKEHGGVLKSSSVQKPGSLVLGNKTGKRNLPNLTDLENLMISAAVHYEPIEFCANSMLHSQGPFVILQRQISP